MKTEIKKMDSTIREITVEVSGDIVKNKFDSAFKQIGTQAKYPGFRPGHVPREILERKFYAAAHEIVMKELLPEVYNKAVEQEKLDVVALPEFSDVKLDQSALSFKAKVDVSPEIKLGEYKGIKLDYKRISVDADEINRNLETIKESRKAEAADDGLARSLGYPDMEELKKALERQIALRKENQQRQSVEGALLEGLSGKLDFKLPQPLIDRQLNDMLRQTKMDLAMKGVPADKLESEEAELRKKLEPEAKAQVKMYLVLSEVAKKEKIEEDEHLPRKVIEFLMKNAEWKIKD